MEVDPKSLEVPSPCNRYPGLQVGEVVDITVLIQDSCHPKVTQFDLEVKGQLGQMVIRVKVEFK